MEKEHLAQVACECLHLDCPQPDLADWESMVDALRTPDKEVNIALVGKYIQLHDAYITAAYDDIRLDPHSLQFFYACLCRLGLHFL